jgi:hypothetical protein
MTAVLATRHIAVCPEKHLAAIRHLVRPFSGVGGVILKGLQ